MSLRCFSFVFPSFFSFSKARDSYLEPNWSGKGTKFTLGGIALNVVTIAEVFTPFAIYVPRHQLWVDNGWYSLLVGHMFNADVSSELTGLVSGSTSNFGSRSLTDTNNFIERRGQHV